MCNVCHWPPDTAAAEAALRAADRQMSALARRLAAIEKAVEADRLFGPHARKRRENRITATMTRTPQGHYPNDLPTTAYHPSAKTQGVTRVAKALRFRNRRRSH